MWWSHNRWQIWSNICETEHNAVNCYNNAARDLRFNGCVMCKHVIVAILEILAKANYGPIFMEVYSVWITYEYVDVNSDKYSFMVVVIQLYELPTID